MTDETMIPMNLEEYITDHGPSLEGLELFVPGVDGREVAIERTSAVDPDGYFDALYPTGEIRRIHVIDVECRIYTSRN